LPANYNFQRNISGGHILTSIIYSCFTVWIWGSAFGCFQGFSYLLYLTQNNRVVEGL